VAVAAFLQHQWAKTLDYRLINALGTFDAACFAQEWRDDAGRPTRAGRG